MKEVEKMAINYIQQYYNYKIDLETLHNILYKLFGSYKKAVTFLYEHQKAVF